jgi:hypothetical protein
VNKQQEIHVWRSPWLLVSPRCSFFIYRHTQAMEASSPSQHTVNKCGETPNIHTEFVSRTPTQGTPYKIIQRSLSADVPSHKVSLVGRSG